MKRVISIVKGLATSNLVFRGSKEKIDDDNSGTFLKIVRIVAEFDQILKEHLRRIRMAKVKSTILQTVKEAKYFSVILDCTPDIIHEKQMTIVLRCINTATSPIRVEDYFIEFLKVVETTGEALFNELKCTLGALQLDLNDVRGQGYDNGSNMKGHNKGVQARVLQEYPRAFYTPCGCHSLNLVLCDMAMSCTPAKNFFGLIQRVYNFFSGSTKRWDVLAQYVKGRNGEGLTLKQWSDTRWESRLASVKAMRLQAPQIRKALLHIIGHNFDATSISEVDALANFGLKKLDFLIGMVIWFDILNKVNSVSKLLQQKNMDVDVAISLLKGLISFFEEYNEYGFEKAKEEAKKIATEMDVDSNFKESRIRKKKKFFYEIADDEPRECAEDSLRVTYFIPIVDHALSSLRTRFDQFTKYEEIFGFLFNLSKLMTASNESLKCSCVALETFMQHGDNRDVDAEELFSELQLLRRSLPNGTTKAIEVLDYIKKTHLCFPNAWIAYRVLLTIPVTVATAERSFSKLKLIKNYLHSSMSQDRLSGLAMLSIEKKVLDKLDCGPLISNFTSQKARKVKF